MFHSMNQPFIDLQNDFTMTAGPSLSGNPLAMLLPLIAAVAVSMVIIPVMARLAGRFGLVDKPDPRKVHERPVPRIGGFGIFLGTMMPVVLLLPFDQTLAAFLVGAVVLFVFGVLDDSRGLGHYAKFTGQFLAVIIVVYLGDVYVTRLPFIQADLISDAAGRLFTVFAMVGMINAINHSDGLDGLAGGEAMLSLCCIAWFAFVAGGDVLIFITLSLVGGLLGFMRYNTYPAIIFMGDGGSQFIGYTLGFLAVLLTQQVNPALSPALPALILGLPIADIIAVFVQRIYKKMNWFRATRNHIHHRLLDLGFFHYESVVIIYSIQTLLVVCAVLMPYENDALILGLYLAIVTSVFIFLVAAERRGWRVHGDRPGAATVGAARTARFRNYFMRVSYWLLAAGLSAFLVTGPLLATSVPADLTLLAMVLCGMMLLRLSIPTMSRVLPLRAMSYMAIAFVVYLAQTYQPAYLSGADPVTYLFFGVMVLCAGVVIRFGEKGSFNLTPTDFLVIIAVTSLAILSSRGLVESRVTAITIKAVILFYCCELVLNRTKFRWNLFTISSLFSLILISLRGMGLLSVS